jgi:hypothetical protein
MSDDLVSALAKAQSEMENAALNSVNPHFKSKYADLAAIRDAVVPALSKHGIAVVQLYQVMEFGPVIVTRLMKGKESIDSVCPIAIGATYKAQDFGSASTYAKRYGLAAICCIAAEEDDDANTAQAGEPAKKVQAKKPDAAPAPSIKDNMIKALEGAPDAPKLLKIFNSTAFTEDFYKLSGDDQAKVKNVFDTKEQSFLVEAA